MNNDPHTRKGQSGTARAVLFCTLGYPPGVTGGAERQAQLQAEALTRLGLIVEVVCPRRPGTRSGSFRGIHVYRLPFINQRPFRTASYVVALFMFLLFRGRRYQMFHVHLAYFQADVVVIAAGVVRRPVWVKIAASGRLGEIARMAPLARFTHNVGLRHATTLQALSPDIAAELTILGVPPTRIVRIPNGVDVSVYKPGRPAARTELRRALDLPADGTIVLFAGRFARHKGIGDLLKAWSSIDLPDAWLVLVGSNETLDPEGPIEGLPGVIVRGWTEDLLSYYRAVDAFVLPSHIEGMSNVVLEAMACGLPVIATRVGAASELISDGNNGLLINVHSSHDLARALKRLLGDEALRGQLGGEARRTIVSSYAIEAVTAKIEAEYRRIWANN